MPPKFAIGILMLKSPGHEPEKRIHRKSIATNRTDLFVIPGVIANISFHEPIIARAEMFVKKKWSHSKSNDN